MKINGVNSLEIGMSNIEIEGEVTYTETPEHRVGTSKKTKKNFDFWSQRIFIDDGTGNIECSISVKDENGGIEKGVIARVKGKLGEWQGNRNIQGKLIAISKGGKVTDVQQEKAEEYFEEKAKEENIITNKLIAKIAANEIKPEKEKAKVENNVWEKKDLRIARECAVKAVTELAVAKIITGTDFFHFANTIVKYIYNGKVNGKEKKSILHDNRQPLEVISDEPLFPAEEIENAVNEREKEEEHGTFVLNTYNNPIPFKGKKKELKKVSKAEDFIAPADMPE